MEARFIILHPDDPGEILLATALIRCLKTQVEESLVYSVVKESQRWLLDSNPYLDEIFVYQDNPMELLEELKDFLPDYLIDLNGSHQVNRFKNRLKVLDFTINRRKTEQPWLARAFDTCKLFDVEDDGKGAQMERTLLYQNVLPGGFWDGYVSLSLDSGKSPRPFTDDQIIQMALITEKPIVITGQVADRRLADQISQSSGCAVFPTCGDLTMAELASVWSNAKGIIVFDQFQGQVANALGIKSFVILKNSDVPDPKTIALWARSQFATENERTAI